MITAEEWQKFKHFYDGLFHPLSQLIYSVVHKSYKNNLLPSSFKPRLVKSLDKLYSHIFSTVPASLVSSLL